MAVNRTRYRQLDFIGARILQARELNWLQEMEQSVSVTDNETLVSGVLQTIYRQGAMFNVTVGVSGLRVTLSATNNALPMYIFVRDKWEIFPGQNDDCTDGVNGTQTGNATMTLSSSQTAVYLNWELRIRTGGLTGDDPSLTDSITNEATASAGELILHLNTTDTSGNALGVSQLAVNTSPIKLLAFTNSGTTLTYVPTDNIQTQALATKTISGLVTNTTGNPLVVSTDDPRLGIANVVADGAVHDSTVRTPIAAGGTNSNSTPIYKLPIDSGTDIGGISAAKIILISATQTLEAGWNWLVNSFNSLLSAFNSHFTAALGLSNTHPLPTAAQVGAAPISHVGLPLGLSTSHPPVVNAASGGFQVNQTLEGRLDDPAYGVFTNGTFIGGVLHNGDVYSKQANVLIASPGGTGITITGAVGFMSTMAGVLTQHVNQTSHANPHGLTASDLGAITSAYPALVSVTTQTVAGTNITGKYLISRFAPNNGNAIEIAIGTGVGISNSSGVQSTGTTFTIPTPTAVSNPSSPFTSANSISGISALSLLENFGFLIAIRTFNPSTNTYSISGWLEDVDANKRNDAGGTAQWWSIWWRQGA